jgi:protease-4
MRRKILAGGILAAIVLSLVLVAVLGGRQGPGPYGTGAAPGGQIGVIHIEGVIVGGRNPSVFSGGGAEDIAARIREAADAPHIRAVVLRLNSPGGSAAASQEISEAVLYLRESGKRVVASMGDVSASGAYWIAAHADHIVANPATITGSIGVIIQTYQLTGLYRILGIETETYKSGPLKDMGAPDREPTPEERAIFQGMVDDIYEQFVAVVARGRGLPEAQVRELADGRIFTGRQAYELGLVDELGGFQDAVRAAAELSGLDPEAVPVVELDRRVLFRQFWFDFASLLRGTPPSWLLVAPAFDQR